jgi:hypothetical protein
MCTPVGAAHHSNREIIRAREIRRLAREIREKSQRLRAELRQRQGIQNQRPTREDNGLGSS